MDLYYEYENIEEVEVYYFHIIPILRLDKDIYEIYDVRRYNHTTNF